MVFAPLHHLGWAASVDPSLGRLFTALRHQEQKERLCTVFGGSWQSHGFISERRSSVLLCYTFLSQQ